MATYSASSPSQVFEDSQIWDSLKMAIASSSGFQSWQMEHQPIDDRYLDTSLDYRVQCYLRETLETLAY
ncbi:hypothetical protein [Argonema galeatum]|uniref:hypothetical protein n=1 Tax=Argonema galeatum TaxID=2942762 RepID=UPI002011D792|nr:hypothetical protein [Argonema galeatum]MCL1465301.1 hypothetical protein [Argonema galeatum A003/A1]